MKKLFLSAFALSLILSASTSFGSSAREVEFLEFDENNLPEILGKNPRGGLDHANADWVVSEKKVEVDLQKPLKGQPHSLVPWSTIEPEDFLSIRTWLIEREIKDSNPEWKIRLRQDSHQELVGKILQCTGTCKILRGLDGVNGQFLSQIVEGDEIRTEKDSIAWIYLMDGSLVRLSPETSFTLNEINFSPKNILLEGRLNEGHVFWHPRGTEELPFDSAPETDAISLPLMLKDANQEQFERKIFMGQNDLERRQEVMALDENAVTNQFTRLNALKKMNNGKSAPKTTMLLVAPNVSLLLRDVSVDFVSLSNGKSYFKKRTTREDELFQIQLRGYTEMDKITIKDSSWNSVESHGRFHSLVSDVPSTLEIMELLTKRIKTIELAREMWFEDYTLPVVAGLKDKKILAEKFGYWLWGDELQKREDFLVEYTRRIETTNLTAIEKLTAKLEARGEELGVKDLSESFYTKSLNYYLLGLKKQYGNEKMRVKEMNNVQYYAWILKNGKK